MFVSNVVDEIAWRFAPCSCYTRGASSHSRDTQLCCTAVCELLMRIPEVGCDAIPHACLLACRKVQIFSHPGIPMICDQLRVSKVLGHLLSALVIHFLPLPDFSLEITYGRPGGCPENPVWHVPGQQPRGTPRWARMLLGGLSSGKRRPGVRARQGQRFPGTGPYGPLPGKTGRN